MKKRSKTQKQMRETIGIDLGDKVSRYCIVDQEGEVVEEGSFRNQASSIEKHFSGEPRRIAVEAGTQSVMERCCLCRNGHPERKLPQVGPVILDRVLNQRHRVDQEAPDSGVFLPASLCQLRHRGYTCGIKIMRQSHMRMIVKRFLAAQVAAMQEFVDPFCLGPPGAYRKMDRLGNRENPHLA